VTAAWGIYALLVGALVSAAAGLAEVVLIRLRRPTRWLWAAAMLATLAIPVVRFTANGRAVPPAAALRLPDATRAMAAGPAPQRSAAAPARWTVRAERGVDALLAAAYHAAGTGTPRRDRFLVAAWMVLSVCVAAGWLRAAWRITRLRRSWGEQLVDGVPVLLSEDVGPAVLGVRRPRTVLPRWILELDAPLRALVLGHEVEHVRARDPLLLAIGFFCTIIVPWQAWLWFQLRRLRLAVETDCDARVLSRFPNVHRYGSLLLFVGRRAAFPHAAPALAGVLSLESHLARRITMMTRPPHRVASKLAALSTLVVLCGAAVFAAPSPQSPAATGVPAQFVGLYLMRAPADFPVGRMMRDEFTYLRLAADGRSRLENLTTSDSTAGVAPAVEVGPWHRNPWSVRPAAAPRGAADSLEGRLCFDLPNHTQPCDFYHRDPGTGDLTLYAAPAATKVTLLLRKVRRH
jgi:hypothetical protein